MLNRDFHLRAGVAAAAVYAIRHARDQQAHCVVVEAVGGTVGGIGGGLLPDWIDTPCSPQHRAEAHSLGISGTAGYYVSDQMSALQASLRSQTQHYAQLRTTSSDLMPQIGFGLSELLFRFLVGALAGLLAGYASHLELDLLSALFRSSVEEQPCPSIRLS